MTEVALIGCGHWGVNILRDLIALGADVDVVEPDPSRARAAGTKGARSVHRGPETLGRCDGVVVATPADTHRNVIEGVLRLGVPVFVEKPPCTSLADVDALLDAGADHVFVMHKWRYHPGVMALQQLAMSGSVGTPTELHTIRVGTEQLPPDMDVIWHLGAHDLSIAFAILGSIGVAGRFAATHTDDGRVLTCSGTVTATLTGGTVVHHLELGAEQTVRTRSVVLVGTTGVARLLSPESPTIEVSTETGTTTIALDRTPPLLRELAAFLAHLDGGPAPVSTLTEARTIVEGLDAISRSIAHPSR